MGHDAVDAAMPLDPEEHRAQLEGLARLLPERSRVIDIGAGLGRLAIPLAEAGHDVLAIDTEADWLAGVRGATSDLEHPVRTHRADALDPDADLAHPEGPADAVLILGNTLALFHDSLACADLFARLRPHLSEGGALYIDHLHTVVWREVREGYWQEGLSEGGDLQLAWDAGDCVVALRHEGDDRFGRDGLAPGDTPLRLWSWGALRLLARAGGFSDPQPLPEHHLVRFRGA